MVVRETGFSPPKEFYLDDLDHCFLLEDQGSLQ